MSDTPKDIARLMKRLQIGVGGRNAIDEAHDIMAECYGTLGKLSADLAERTRERDEAREKADYMGAVARSLAVSLKKITFMTRTSGGWQPDAELIAACEHAEGTLSMPGVSKAIDERDALRAEVERLRRKWADKRMIFQAGRDSYKTDANPMNTDDEAWEEYAAPLTPAEETKT